MDVHYAARLCAAANGRQVLLSASTRALVANVSVDDLGEHGLKDFVVPRRLFHLRLGGVGADQLPPGQFRRAATLAVSPLGELSQLRPA